MTEVVRLTLVSHAMTDAMSAGRFPADESLNDLGRRQVGAARVGVADAAVCAPERRARQTAELAGLTASIEPRLSDLDVGAWRAGSLDDIEPGAVGVWLADPAAAPHGGESIVQLIERVGGWLASLTARPTRVVAVTHPAVIRAAVVAALDAPPKSFWRIDIAPMSRTVMHYRTQAWTLRMH